MSRYIDAMIPGAIGLLIVGFPRVFLKTANHSPEELDRRIRKIRRLGVGLLLVALVYAWIAHIGRS